MNQHLDTPEPTAENYTCFMVSEEEYGVLSEHVIEVRQNPKVRSVPRAPSFIRGVANIGGRIIPILNTRDRFGQTESGAESESKTQPDKLLVAQVNGVPYGLLIDRVTSVYLLARENIEPVNPVLVDKALPFVIGMASPGGHIIHLLDLEALIHAGLGIDPDKRSAYREHATRMADLRKIKTKAVSKRFLVFRIGREEWGLGIEALDGVALGEKLETVSGGPDYLAGVLHFLGAIVPIIYFQKLFDRGESSGPGSKSISPGKSDNPGKTGKIIIVRSGTYQYGILAEKANEIIDITPEQLKTPPAVIAGSETAHIGKVAYLQEGKRLVLLIDETRLLSEKEVNKLSKVEGVAPDGKTTGPRETRREAHNSFLLLTVSGIEFALPMETLSEVTPYRPPNRVPKAPPHIRGLLSVKGELVSVVDLRQVLQLGAPSLGDEKRIVIVVHETVKFGIIADKITEIMVVGEADILPPPDVIDKIDTSYVKGLIRIENSDRAPILLQLEKIVG